MNFKKITTIILTLVLLSLTLVGCGGKQDPSGEGDELSLKFAHTNSVESNSHRMAVKFAETVETLSEGKITIQVLPQYSGERDLIESAQRGDIDFTYTSAAPLVSFVPEMAVFDVPFLFSSKEDIFATIKNAFTVFDNEDVIASTLGKMDKSNIKGFGYWSKGFRVLATGKPIETLADLEGLKLRTMENSNHIAAWKALGANPAPLAFNEVYTSLEQGTIEAQEQPFDVLSSNKFYEVQTHATSINMIADVCVFMGSLDLYSGLTDEQRAIIDEAAATAIAFAREDSLAAVNKDIETLENGGMTVSDFTTEERAEAIKLAKPVETQIRSEIGDEIVDLFYSVQEK